MKKITLFAFLLAAFVISSYAQKFEYGKPEELKNLKKVYVDTQADLKNRERIVQEIEKANVGLEIVESLDDAEIIIQFGGENVLITTGATTQPIYGTNSTSTTVNRRKVATGSGYVFIKGKTRDVPRVVMNFESTQDKVGEKKPATKLAKEFIKAYKKANGLKE
jgi:hypothetical protein